MYVRGLQTFLRITLDTTNKWSAVVHGKNLFMKEFKRAKVSVIVVRTLSRRIVDKIPFLKSVLNRTLRE